MRERLLLKSAMLGMGWMGIALFVSAARADTLPGTVVPLYSLGTYTDSQGAIYTNADIHPAGEGVFQPFERIHSTHNYPYEQGFNTNYDSGKQLDNLTHGDQTWNHAIPLSDIATVTVSGTQYYEFDLNLNQTGNGGSYESLDKVQIFQTSVADITNYQGAETTGAPTDNFYDSHGNPLATKVYDEDAGAAADTTINLNSRLNNGQGTGTADMSLFVPKALFVGNQQYVVLYSSFGDPNASKPKNSSTPGFFPVTGGHEDWRYNDQPTTTPLPATFSVGLSLLGGLGLLGGFNALRRRRVI